MLYRWKVRSLKVPRLNLLWRRWRGWQGEPVGNYGQLPDLIRRHAPGKSFADIGCMWGVDGEYAFVAAEAGAQRVVGVDVFGPTPEFEQKRAARAPGVVFVLGDISRPDTFNRVGTVDVVFCAGVLYHHPSPFDLLVALRRICGETLILRTSTIPEVRGLPNAAVYFPMLDQRGRELWNLKPLGVTYQAGISDAFRPDEGYGNWFWGLTPSCLESLLATAGFKVEWRATEAFAQTVICSAVTSAFTHRLPGEDEARRMAEEISAAGVAKPA
jgi:SAM-dependent methyltransferase